MPQNHSWDNEATGGNEQGSPGLMLSACFKHRETINMLWRTNLQGQGEGDVGKKMGKRHVPLVLVPDPLKM